MTMPQLYHGFTLIQKADAEIEHLFMLREVALHVGLEEKAEEAEKEIRAIRRAAKQAAKIIAPSTLLN